LALALAFLAMSRVAPAAGLEADLESLRKPGQSLADEAAEPAAAAIRDLAMREAATGTALQAGARWRYSRILEEAVLPRAAELDALFDFGSLVGRRGRLVIVPPVVTSAGDALLVESPVSASSQAGGYRLVRGARLIAVVPDWRHYLLELPEGPKGPHPSLLPKGAAELGRWRRWVDSGWEMGARRAEALFAENVARLARDYSGMMLFRRLAAESLAKGPVTDETFSAMEMTDDEIVFEWRAYRLTSTGRFEAAGQKATAPSGR
jgi:defect-in-organelle-trafficking protein DotC